MNNRKTNESPPPPLQAKEGCNMGGQLAVCMQVLTILDK